METNSPPPHPHTHTHTVSLPLPTSPRAMICLISVLLLVFRLAVSWPAVDTSRGMPSAHVNIFMALRELVDHKITAPSTEPEANKLAEIKQQQDSTTDGWKKMVETKYYYCIKRRMLRKSMSLNITFTYAYMYVLKAFLQQRMKYWFFSVRILR